MSSLTRRQAIGTLGAFALPWDRLVAQANPKAAAGAAVGEAAGVLRPDLENLHPLMEWIASQRPLRLSFLDSQWRDQLYPLAAMQGAVDQLTRIYAKAGIPERFRGTFYDSPHVFQPPMQEETFDWLERWL